MLEELNKRSMGSLDLGKPAYEHKPISLEDIYASDSETYGDIVIVVPGNGNNVTVTDDENNTNQTNVSGNNNGSITQTNSKVSQRASIKNY